MVIGTSCMRFSREDEEAREWMVRVLCHEAREERIESRKAQRGRAGWAFENRQQMKTPSEEQP